MCYDLSLDGWHRGYLKCVHNGHRHSTSTRQPICISLFREPSSACQPYIEKKKKVRVKSTTIKEQLMLFINCVIENPSFDSQTKDYLNTPVSKFGSRCEVSDKCIDKIIKMGAMEAAGPWFDELYNDYDAILTPSALGEAPRIVEGTGDPICCVIWTLAGLPCIALPLLEGEAGLPMGIQLVGRHNEDDRLFRTARWLLGSLSS